MRQPHQTIRQYLLKKRLGVGGMGEVWLASTSGPHGFTKNVCIKAMLPEASTFLDYFAAEARVGGRLTHSNLINVFDFFEVAGEYFIVMEYIDGINVHDLLEKVRTLPPSLACYVVWCALKGLHHAHTAALGGPGRGGLVHRDISPDNIIISGDAEVKVMDFGVAQLEVEWRKKTQAANAFRGKPLYVSPEYLKGEPLDGRADVYQIGIVLYEMLAGAHPFAGVSSTYAVSRMIVEGEYRPLRAARPDLDPAIGAVVEQMMHHDREKRFASADAARVAVARVCPDLLVADRTLAELVLDVTAPKRRPTSPFIRLKDLPRLTMEAPPQAPGGGVVVAAAHDEATMPVTVAAVARAINAPEPIHKTPLLPEREDSAPVGEMNNAKTEMVVGRRGSRAPLFAAVVTATALVVIAGTALLVRQHHAGNLAGAAPPPAAPSQAAQLAAASPPAPAAPEVPHLVSAVPSPPALAPRAATPRAAPAATEPTTRPSEGKPRRHHRTEEAAATTGRIVVHRETQPIRVSVDGVAVGSAPLSFEVEKGKHDVTLVRGTGPHADTMTTQVDVAAGHRYPLNSGDDVP